MLIEADKLGLTAKAEGDANFNPVNYLAQYLMRNNPRYSNFSEASPYVKSLREIGEVLKAQIFQLEDNKYEIIFLFLMFFLVVVKIRLLLVVVSAVNYDLYSTGLSSMMLI